MMDKGDYEAARDRSSGLFKNALVLPVAIAILRTAEEGATFVISELREKLGGQAADESIRKALDRLVSIEAAILLTSPGPPRRDVWERQAHPFWTFVIDWVGQLGSEAEKPEDTAEKMGDPGFEPGTSSLSETRSNQLS